MQEGTVSGLGFPRWWLILVPLGIIAILLAAGLVGGSLQSSLQLTFAPDPLETVEYRIEITDDQGKPVIGVQIINEAGTVVGTTIEPWGAGLIRDRFVNGSWYLRPAFDNPQFRAGAGDMSWPSLVEGVFVSLSESERASLANGVQVLRVQLPRLGAKSSSSISRDSTSLKRDAGSSETQSDGEGIPSPMLPMAQSFLEEDLFEPSNSEKTDEDTQLSASVPSAVPGIVRSEIVGPEQQGHASSAVSEAASQTEALDEAGLMVSAAAGDLRVLEAELLASVAAVAKEESGSSGEPLGESGAESKHQATHHDSVVRQEGQEGPGAASFPSALDRMNEWAMPPALYRTLYLETKLRQSRALTEVVDGAENSATGQVDQNEVTKIFGISTTKEVELKLGEITGSGQLAVKVPEAGRFDSLRVEHAQCGGFVVPMLASAPGAAQQLVCPEQLLGQPMPTVGVMYRSHGQLRYFSGGKIDWDGRGSDLAPKISLFAALSPAHNPIFARQLTFHHPGVSGGVLDLKALTVEGSGQMPIASGAAAAVAGHLLYELPEPPGVRPRVSLRFEKGSGASHIDLGLVKRFERAFQATFVNAKSFIPVPWGAVERQSGLKWQLLEEDKGGWAGTVLDLVIDYVLVITAGSDGVKTVWYDRDGNKRKPQNHNYVQGIPPELLARDVFDAVVDELPAGPLETAAAR
jgi:hypothetical protein